MGIAFASRMMKVGSVNKDIHILKVMEAMLKLYGENLMSWWSFCAIINRMKVMILNMTCRRAFLNITKLLKQCTNWQSVDT